MKLNSKQLRNLDISKADLRLNSRKRRPIYFIIENVYDTYNVGGLFRLADALNIEKIYLCGDTETPPNHKIVKASVGTYKVVPWAYKVSAKKAIEELRITHYPSASLRAGALKSRNPKSVIRNRGITIMGVEQASGSIDYREVKYDLPLALVLGNETSGVTQEALKLCDQIVEIPMWGINVSLNVIVSAAVVAYLAVEL